MWDEGNALEKDCDCHGHIVDLERKVSALGAKLAVGERLQELGPVEFDNDFTSAPQAVRALCVTPAHFRQPSKACRPNEMTPTFCANAFNEYDLIIRDLVALFDDEPVPVA